LGNEKMRKWGSADLGEQFINRGWGISKERYATSDKCRRCLDGLHAVADRNILGSHAKRMWSLIGKNAPGAGRKDG